ncbi:MAG: hypothetical protein HVK28_02850 [Pelagibacteraceae bacterium]|nr:hypothetical protein [Pelagibacteraceae bacterium]
MNSFDACVIGQIVKDYNFLPVKGKKCVKLAGGTAFYSTHAYYTLGLKTAVLTSFNKNDIFDLTPDFKNGKISIFNNKKATTTEFRNYYRKNKLNFRSQEAIFNNRPVTGKLGKARIYHFGPLISNDIDIKLYQVVKKLNGLKVIDIQGLYRSIREKKIVEKRNTKVEKFLKYFNILKCDTRELHLIKNFDDKYKIINYLFDLGISEVIVTKGVFGSTIYSKSEGKISIPSFIPTKVIDSTGCGDTYAAIYCYSRLKKYSIYHSGLLASAGSGMKTEKTGGLNSSFKMIKKRANSICQI